MQTLCKVKRRQVTLFFAFVFFFNVPIQISVGVTISNGDSFACKGSWDIDTCCAIETDSIFKENCLIWWSAHLFIHFFILFHQKRKGKKEEWNDDWKTFMEMEKYIGFGYYEWMIKKNGDGKNGKRQKNRLKIKKEKLLNIGRNEK